MKGFLSRVSLFALFVLSVVMAGASPVDDSEIPFVLDGRVALVSPASGAMRWMDVPVPVFSLFANSGDQLFLAAEPREVMPFSDEWGGFNLWSASVESGASFRLTSDREVLGATWSAANQKVYYWTRDMEILAIEAGSMAPERVVSLATSPAISPDGSFLAYNGLPSDWLPGSLPGTFDLKVLELASGVVRTLTTGYDDSEPVWTPDGAELLFRSGTRTGLTSMWRIRPDGTGLTQLTNVGAAAVSADFVPVFASNRDAKWSEDGRVLAFFSNEAEGGRIWAAHFDRQGQFVHVRAMGSGLVPAWISSDSLVVARQVGARVHLEELWTDGRSPARSLAILPGRLDRRTDVAAAMPLEETDESPRSAPSMLRIAAAVKYRLPLLFNPGYSAYYDNDSGGGVLDWSCGGYTYDGHQGTDLLASAGSTVVAAASGSVSGRNDGCDTVGYWGSTCGGGYGNYIKLDSSGWTSYYAHMTNGTPTTAGSVSCGQTVGLSGSSGNSTGYHLHFEVRYYGYPYDDPFSGTCSGPESFWTLQRGGYPVRMCWY